MKQIIIFLTFLNFAASQGMLAKGKQKLEEMENTIRENAAKLNIKTPASFNGERQDLKKIGQLKRKTKEETKKNGKKKFVPTDTWSSFGSIGNNVQITDLRMGEYNKKVKDESSFFTRTVSRPYQFSVIVDGNKSDCQCEAKVSKTVYWPLLLKERPMLLGFIRDLTSKVNEKLYCTITNSSGQESSLEMSYNEKKIKLGLKNKIAGKLLPEEMRDDGKRVDLRGNLSSNDKSFVLRSTYDYDLSFLGDDSPFSIIKPPVGYYVSNENNEYMMVKDPAKFRVNKNVTNKKELGTYYSALLASYFWLPQHGTFKSHKKGRKKSPDEISVPTKVLGVTAYKTIKGKNYKVNRYIDFFEKARYRGAFGLF